MTTITLKHLNFAYSRQTPLFTDTSFNLDTSWKLGLVGRNGRGKTTLLEILQGKLSASGEINVPCALHYFPQPIEDETQLTLAAMQAQSAVESWQLERELNLLHVDAAVLDRPFALLSGGEQTKVRLALLFTDQGSFALIDEPTNHLDLDSRAQVADYLKTKSGFIVVSHDQHFLDSVTDHTLAIDKAAITLYQGNYQVYRQEKARQDAFAVSENARLNQDIGRLKQTASQKGRWSASREGDKYGNPHVKNSGGVANKGYIGARAARVMQKRKNLEHRMAKEITQKEGLLKNIETVDPLKINTTADHHAVYLTAENLTLSYNSQPLFQPLSFELKRGERLALIGPNGIGKSSLIQALFHQFQGEVSGTITYPPALSFSLVRQQYADNTGSLAAFADKHHLAYQDLLNNLKKLGMPRSAFTTPIESLSMGQQKKVELAKSLVQPANVLVWDEPLNYLDLDNQAQLEASLKASAPTMLFIEHDQAFIDRIATKVIRLEHA